MDSNEAHCEESRIAPTVPHRVVILGGGFAGLEAAKELSRQPVEIVLVDKRNFHLFQPLLYQVATGGLSPADITMPLRAILARKRNVTVLMDEALDLEPDERVVLLEHLRLRYDTLIVATGTRHHYFGRPEWEARAPGLKTIEDALSIRSRILRSFEQAEMASSSSERQRLLTFIVIGGGPTGVELAGAIAELARYTLQDEFRGFDPADARILLIEGRDRILPPYDPRLSVAAQRALEALGVELLLDATVSGIDPHSVTLKRAGDEWREPAGTILWAAGVEPSPLAKVLHEKANTELDSVGRVKVSPNCSLTDYPEILVLGDLAHLVDSKTGEPLPGVAPVAMQQGHYAARLIHDRLRQRHSTPPFRYRMRGQLAVIGRARAVAQIGGARVSGYLAWLLWLFVHIMYLVGFENRMLVGIQWAYSYFNRGRAARLITEARPESSSGTETGRTL